MALSLHKALPNLSRLEPLHETNYRRWSHKLLIFFEQLEINYVLLFDLTEENNISETTIDSMMGLNSKTIDDETRRKFEKDNKAIRGHLLNCMLKLLFNLFVSFKFAKINWEKLKVKYRVDDAGKNRYMVREWLRFQIINDQAIKNKNLYTEVLN